MHEEEKEGEALREVDMAGLMQELQIRSKLEKSVWDALMKKDRMGRTIEETLEDKDGWG